MKNTYNRRKLSIYIFLASLSLVFLILITTFIWRYFGDNPTISKSKPVAKVDTQEDPSASRDFVAVDEPDYAGITPGVALAQNTQHTIQPKITNNNFSGISNPTASRRWVANNYKFGDIIGNTHLVIIGDTLWEISEGKYGTGWSWRKIADNNNVKYKNRTIPLITPGMILNLP